MARGGVRCQASVDASALRAHSGCCLPLRRLRADARSGRARTRVAVVVEVEVRKENVVLRLAVCFFC